MKKFLLCKLILICCWYTIYANRDPFSVLGIPSLNPSQMFKEEIDSQVSQNTSHLQTKHLNNLIPVQRLKTIEDLPNFLQNTNIPANDKIKIISKFLISDDYLLKNYGAVFDQSGFDEVAQLEKIFPFRTKERAFQRARSAAKIFFNNNYNEMDYDSYGAEKLQISNLPNGWEVYKVLLVGKQTVNEHLFLKVCLPLDEMLPSLVVDFNGECVDKIKYVEEAKLKNAPYLEKIKQTYLSAEGLSKGPKKKDNKKLSLINSNISDLIKNKNNILNPPSGKKAENNENSQNVNTPSFISKNENVISLSKLQQNPTQTNLRNNTLQPEALYGLEQKVENINQKLYKLENRVESDEKITYSTQADIKDLKTNLDKNFNKLDKVLEMLANKLK